MENINEACRLQENITRNCSMETGSFFPLAIQTIGRIKLTYFEATNKYRLEEKERVRIDV